MPKNTLKLVEKRNLWLLISAVIIATGLMLMGIRAIQHQPPMNFGIDFTGGTSFILRFDALHKNSVEESKENKKIVHARFINDMRKVLTAFGLEKSQIQITQDKEVLIRTIELTQKTRLALLSGLEERFGVLELMEVDVIGPTIGAELREQSIWIILIVSLALLIYIWWRFELLFGAAALLAVLHDALIIISVAAFLSIEINTAFVAALLTILGYSINDTIVIFDRIRENLHHTKSRDIISLVNLSIQQMLSRSIHTSITTLLVISCLLVFGGTTIKEFAFILLVGIISGTYSSIFIASPVLAHVLAKRNDE